MTSARSALALLAAALLALSGAGAFAQGARTIKIVVPYTPGSGPDILSRLMSEQIGSTSRSAARTGPPSWSRTARAAAP